MAAAGQGDAEPAALVVRGEQAEDDGAEARVGSVVLVVEDGVEVVQDGGGVGVVHRGGAQGVAGQGGDGRGGGALAAHVAHEEAPGSRGQWEEIVEVAADLVDGRDVVVRGDLQTGHVRERGREQGLLQRGGQLLQALAFLLGLRAGTQEFGLVGAAVTGVEECRTDQEGLSVAARLHGGGDQDRQP